jgi:protein-disulfide isomerase
MIADRRLRARVLLAALLLVTAAIAACGGSRPPPPAVVAVAPPPPAPPPPAAPPPPDSSVFDAQGWVPVSPEDPQIGSQMALVTLVEFGDFQCPFTMRAQATMGQLMDNYGPDKLRIVWKNLPLPFHDKAEGTAEAAEGVRALAGNDAFWRFHDIVFRNQGELTPDILPTWAERAGVTRIAELKAGLAAHTWKAKVDSDVALSKLAGANGTPSFFVEGELMSGAQPFDRFKTVIDEQLAKAQAKLAAGTPREQLYSVLSNENKTAQPVEKPEKVDVVAEDRITVHKVPVGRSPVRGRADALVTVIEFGDFQCPFTRRAETMVKQIVGTYGDKVRIVWKNEPLAFHTRAEPAAEVALETLKEKHNDAFWLVHDDLLLSAKLEDDDLLAIATAHAVDRTRAGSAITNHTHRAAIDADHHTAQAFAATGTPTFFINGRRVVGAVPFETMKTIIDEEIAHAERVLQDGSPRARIYEVLTKDGKPGAPVPPPKKPAPPLGRAKG